MLSTCEHPRCLNPTKSDISAYTYRDAVVICISDHLILYFFPSFQGLVKINLLGMSKSCCDKRDKFFFVFRKPWAKTSQCKGCTHQHWIAKTLCSSNSLANFKRKAWFTIFSLQNAFSGVLKTFEVGVRATIKLETKLVETLWPWHQFKCFLMTLCTSKGKTAGLPPK